MEEEISTKLQMMNKSTRLKDLQTCNCDKARRGEADCPGYLTWHGMVLFNSMATDSD